MTGDSKKRDRRKSRPVPVESILETVLESTGLNRRASEREVLEAWPKIAGPRIAEHVRAVDVDEGTLLLAADHPAWRQELGMLFPELLKKFAAAHGSDVVQAIDWVDRRRGGRSRR